MWCKIKQQQDDTCQSCTRQVSFLPVRPGLSVTPSQMLELSSAGIPVSGANASNFFDGVANPSFDVPLDRVRGVDIAELWENRYETNGKFIQYTRRAKFAKED